MDRAGKALLQGSKDVIVKHTDRKTDRESENSGPFNLRQELYSRERGCNDFDFKSYVNIVYFIFLLYYISIKCILPIEFRINSMSDKYNIYYVVDVLHSDDLFLLICIHLLDFPLFVVAPILVPKAKLGHSNYVHYWFLIFMRLFNWVGFNT